MVSPCLNKHGLQKTRSGWADIDDPCGERDQFRQPSTVLVVNIALSHPFPNQTETFRGYRILGDGWGGVEVMKWHGELLRKCKQLHVQAAFISAQQVKWMVGRPRIFASGWQLGLQESVDKPRRMF